MMKNRIWSSGVAAIVLVLSIGLIGCATTGTRGTGQLNVPRNLSVSVDGRLMTITWDAVDNAMVYIIHTTSENCSSGNRIINTATRQAWSSSTNAAIPETNIYFSMEAFELDIEARRAAMAGGPIIFINDTTVAIWLMSESMQLLDEVMATSLSARISAIAFVDSGYSREVRLNKTQYN